MGTARKKFKYLWPSIEDTVGKSLYYTAVVFRTAVVYLEYFYAESKQEYNIYTFICAHIYMYIYKICRKERKKP